MRGERQMEIGKSFLIQHFMDTLWMIRPDSLRNMTEVLLKKASEGYGGSFDLLQAEPKADKAGLVQRVGSVAILNVEGVMVPKASWLDSLCGFISTIELHNQFNILVNDPSVQRIVLYFDSPGGSSTAIFEFAESVFNARSIKEIVSFTDTCMCSAAAAVGFAADQVVATPSATIGSIGTYITLIKDKPESQDYDIHFIQAGDNKLFGSPSVPLSNDEVSFFKDMVDKHYELFTSNIAKFRNVTQDEVKATKASFYGASEAPEWMYDALADSNYVLS